MTNTEADAIAVKCTVKIVTDLTDRRGLKHAFETIDSDIQAEIVDTWGALIGDEIKASGWLSPADLSIRDAEVTRKALQMAAEKVRHDCQACEGSGHADAETECEYCGRPMQAILALSPNVEGYVMVPVDKVSRLREFLQDWQCGRGGDYDQDVADFLAMTTGAKQ